MKIGIPLAVLIGTLLLAGPVKAQTSDDRARDIAPLIQAASIRYGVDQRLIWAIAWMESRYQQRVVSPKGARGIMQLMPATAVRLGVVNAFDPAQNIDGGTRYLRYLLELFKGDVALAMAGYNAGEGAVIKYGYRVPPYKETRNYVFTGCSILSRWGIAASHNALQLVAMNSNKIPVLKPVVDEPVNKENFIENQQEQPKTLSFSRKVNREMEEQTVPVKEDKPMTGSFVRAVSKPPSVTQ